MARVFTVDASSGIQRLLNRLTDQKTGSDEYAHTFYELGVHFGKILLERINGADSINLASTVEDADYLSRGMIEVLEKAGKNVQLTVFWNKRFTPNEENGIVIAPILKEFHQKSPRKTTCLIVVKSIISSSCVVRTNLTRLIEESTPASIFVVAPVLLKGARATLESEFDRKVSDQFKYLYFAEDDVRTNDGIVVPGIGGDIYSRLGWNGAAGKNRHVPAIVKERR